MGIRGSSTIPGPPPCEPVVHRSRLRREIGGRAADRGGVIARKNPSQELLELTEAQAGVVSSTQLTDLHAPKGALKRWRQQWTRMGPGLYCVTPPTFTSWCWAGLVRAGAGLAISGLAALHLDELTTKAPADHSPGTPGVIASIPSAMRPSRWFSGGASVGAKEIRLAPRCSRRSWTLGERPTRTTSSLWSRGPSARARSRRSSFVMRSTPAGACSSGG